MSIILDGTSGINTPNTFAYKNLLIDAGFTINQRGYVSAATEDMYVVDFTEIEKVQIVKSLQDEIETIQEELDSFNATTEVEY